MTVGSEDNSFAVTAAGELFTWGDRTYERLGHGDTATQVVPMRVAALQGQWVVAVSAGLQHTDAVTRHGIVFGWGLEEGLGLDTAESTVSISGVKLPINTMRPASAPAPALRTSALNAIGGAVIVTTASRLRFDTGGPNARTRVASYSEITYYSGNSLYIRNAK